MSAFSWSVRVYWEDTDGGGVVYYANYLKFLERARTEWLRSLGFSQHALAQDPGIIFPVVESSIQYRRPARLDDELLVSCEAQLARRRQRSASQQRVSRRAANAAAGTETIAEAVRRSLAWMPRTFRPKRLPPFLMNALGAPEALT